MSPSRREFLHHAAGAAALWAAGPSIPLFLARTAAADDPPDTPGRPGERILVVIQLTGGNDGLNTVIPWRDDDYYRLRPTIAIPRGQALRLDDDLGLHPQLRGLKSLFDDGSLAVIENVGYPNPDRSHFRSMDIWHTADPALSRPDTGWLGRVIDTCGTGFQPVSSFPLPLGEGQGEGRSGAGGCGTGFQPVSSGPLALHLDAEALPLALRAATRSIPSVDDIRSLRLNSDPATVDALRRIAASTEASPSGRSSADDTLLYIRRATVAGCDNARRLESVLQNDKAAPAYPDFPLARRLKQIAALIDAGLGTRIYYTSLNGFDTHAKQAAAHGPLLAQLGDSLKAFYADLAARGSAGAVLTMTFSEFGRRVAENGGQGTDHGVAAPMFLAGPVAAGLHGGRPNLADLTDGDLRHTIDFRQVYSTVLSNWLQIDPAPILGRDFASLRSLLRT